MKNIMVIELTKEDADKPTRQIAGTIQTIRELQGDDLPILFDGDRDAVERWISVEELVDKVIEWTSLK